MKPQTLSVKLANITAMILNSIISRSNAHASLLFLLELDRQLYALIGQTAKRYNNGIHPKHNLTKYHEFFIKHLKPDDSVLDIGCGQGELDSDIVKALSKIHIYGIDLNARNIETAREKFKHARLTFICGDALDADVLPHQHFDTVILSNVLEHIDKRIDFLKTIVKVVKPKTLLIRVPSYERDWQVPLQEELGIDYRLDPTHYIEYTQEKFNEEINKAGLKINSLEERWGEIWSDVKPIKGL